MYLQVGVTTLERKHCGPFGYGQENLPSKSPIQQDSVLQGEVQTGHPEAWGSHSSQHVALALNKELPEWVTTLQTCMSIGIFVCTELGITGL